MPGSTNTTVTIANEATPGADLDDHVLQRRGDEVGELPAGATYQVFVRRNPGDLGLSDEEFDAATDEFNEVCGTLYTATHAAAHPPRARSRRRAQWPQPYPIADLATPAAIGHPS